MSTIVVSINVKVVKNYGKQEVKEVSKGFHFAMGKHGIKRWDPTTETMKNDIEYVKTDVYNDTYNESMNIMNNFSMR